MTIEATASSVTPRIDYSLIATEQGWQLTAWEPALTGGKRQKPFLWKYNLEFATLHEAHETLEVILGEWSSQLE